MGKYCAGLIITLVVAPLTAGGVAHATSAAPVQSLTSGNNFINFCATVPTAITNATQTVTGSCNPSPGGQ
jgi:hypothetical protein